MKKKSFISENGELVLSPHAPKTLVDVFNEVELIVEEKLDTIFNALQQQEYLPEGMNIAGIDLTDDGKILTFEEQEKIETHVSKLYKQRQKMRHLLVGIENILIPQAVLKDLVKRLDLCIIYQTESGKTVYTIPQFISDDNKLLKVPNNIRQAMINLWNIIGTKKGFRISTLAYRHITDNIFPLSTSFGLFVEYGEYVAIIPATFYNITEMEQQFINKALEVGEKWDACAYVYN